MKMQNREHEPGKQKVKRPSARKDAGLANRRLPSTPTSAEMAKQKAGVCLLLHYGQSFSCDEPILQEADQLHYWRVPVWFATAAEGRKEKLGELLVNAQTGEVLDGQARCQTMKNAARMLPHHASQDRLPLS